MTRVLVLGGSGMVGHVVGTHLHEVGLEVTAVSRRPVPGLRHCSVDLQTGLERLRAELSTRYDAVLNFAGILNTTANCDPAKTVWLNSWFPHWLNKEAEQFGARLIHMSTDCVFSGERGTYAEDDVPDARDLYGRSKALGEVRHQALTIRTSVVGPDLFVDGAGLFNWFMAQPGRIGGYPRVKWTGVTTIQLAKSVEAILANGPATGLIHLVNGGPISKLDLLRVFNQTFPRSGRVVEPNPEVESDKSLTMSKTRGIPVIPSYASMVDDMKLWIDEHRSFYPHYV